MLSTKELPGILWTGFPSLIPQALMRRRVLNPESGAESSLPVAVVFPLSQLMWDGVRLHMGLGGQSQGPHQSSLWCTGRKARLEKVTACAPNSATQGFYDLGQGSEPL